MADTKPPDNSTAGLLGVPQPASGNATGDPGRISSTIKSAVLIPVEKSFRRNMGDLGSLQAMPGLMVGFMGVLQKLLGIAVDNVISVSVEGVGPQFAIRRLVDELNAYPDLLSQPGSVYGEELRSSADARLAELCRHPSYGPILTSAVKVLKRTAVLNSWTAFECVAADSWAAVLDENPIPFGQRAIGSLRLGEDGDLTAKHISVGLAARHGFDLRHCLGTLLRPKFDFASVEGIKRAFDAAFRDTKRGVELQSILSKPILRKLEVTRNLIVHRAGIVDSEYNRQLSSDLPIGEQLEISDDQIKEFVENAGIASGAILLFLDDWLADPHAA
jgi:hypothetical protein